MANDFDSIFGDYQPPSALEKVAGALRKLGHTLSAIPILNFFAAIPIAVSTALDATDGYFNKGFGAGTKNLVSGALDTIVTQATSWWIPAHQWVAVLATGDSIGELARKGSDAVLDSIIPDSFSSVKSPTQLARDMQVLGAAPMTIGAIPAAVGYAQLPQMQMNMQAPINPATLAPVQPNQWRQMEAQRRGQTLEQADAQWIGSNREEALALQRAGGAPLQVGA